MADNLAITPGVGALAKTDQDAVSGGHIQVVKLAVSADGDATHLPATVTYGMTVDVTRLPATAATETTLAGIKIGTDKIPASPAQEHVTQGSPHSVRLTDGSAFYKATTPSDTQPISAASLPLPTGAAQEHAAAASPHAARLSDGAAFYKATTPADTQPISAASLPLPTGAAQEHATAVSPHAVRLSTGAAFYDAPTAAQLPAALVGGRLDVNVGAGTITVSNVTANQGTAAAVGSAWPVKVSDGSATCGISDVGGAKALKVDVIQSVGAGSKVDKSAFTEGASTLDAIGGVYNEAVVGDPTEDQVAALRITAKRGLHVNPRSSDGTELGTAGNPVRVNPTGATAQPVSGTVTANIGTAGTLLTEAAFQARVNTLGQKVMASSTPVVIASDQSAVPVSGTVTANQGTANATPWNENISQVGGAAVVTAAAGVQKVGVVDEAGASFSDTNPAPVETTPLGRTVIRKAFTYAALATAQDIWTPGGGKKWILTRMIITPTAAGGLLKIFDNTDAAANMIYQGQPPLGAIVIEFANKSPASAANNVLRYSTGAASTGDVTVEGYEV